MIELSVIRDLVAIFGVIAGFSYYVLTVRHNQKNQEIMIKNQELQLETRQSQIYLGFWEKLNSTDTFDSLFYIRDNIPTSYEEFEQLLYDEEWGTHFHNYFAVNEAVGVFVNEDLMNIRVFVRDAGGAFPLMMMQYGEFMKERREKGPNPRFYIETALLYDKVLEFAKNNPEFNIPTP